MEFSPQQSQAIDAVATWLRRDDQPIFRLFGFAGTGKTTLAKHLAAQMNGDVVFCAFTGKAAHVLKTKGCPNATTIHSLIYRPKVKSRRRLRDMQEALAEAIGNDDAKSIIALEKAIDEEKIKVKQPSFELNEESKIRDADLIVVDECSMVGADMAHDLMSFGIPILVLGDPAQLPPVKSKGFFTEAKPDFMLTDIHRQAEESPIIRLATMVRKGLRLDVGKYGDSEVLLVADFDNSLLTTEQIIVGKNATRHRANRKRRECLGFTSPFPEKGDRVVCLRNNHDLGLLNGAIWMVDTMYSHEGDIIDVRLNAEDEDRMLRVDMHQAPFIGEEMPYWERDAQEFDFGYALTGHKAQGSQWPSVVVVDESSTFRQDKHRWLYTSITRASEKVVIVR